MRSPFLCACGCGDNVAQQGAYVPGHEKPSVARKYRAQKSAALAEIRVQKAERTKLPPHFGRGAGTPLGEEIKHGRAPYFGRGGINGIV